MADAEEPVDPLPQLKEDCGKTPKCASMWKDYEACAGRVNAKGFGTCEPWFFDYLKCVDKCVVPQVFKYTK